jgi:hypothetical protein
MKPHLHFFVVLFAVTLVGACASPSPPTRQVTGMDAQRTAQNCVQGVGLGGSIQYETCLVQRPGREFSPMAEMAQPELVTVLRTPVGTFANPTRWTVEIRRDGQFLMRREVDGILQDVREGDQFIEVETRTPLAGLEEIEPGTYEIFYFGEGDDEPAATPTIEVGDETEPLP